MVRDKQEMLPFEKIKSELLALCTGGHTGDLCLFTDNRHTAVISIRDGDIVGLRYRISRGMKALEQIKGIEKAKVNFQQNSVNTERVDMSMMPATVEIFNILGIKFGHGVHRETGKLVLVVEDSMTQRNIICKMLVQNGYKVVEADNGIAALEKIESVTPDLILLDIVMPGMNGYEVMSAIKAKDEMKEVPVIMLTSRDGLIDKMRGKVSGTDEYLTKPFTSDALLNKVDKYLRIESDINNIVPQV